VSTAREKKERDRWIGKLSTDLAVLDILDPIPPFEKQSAGLVDLGDRIVSLSQTHEPQGPDGIRSEAAN
jgi:hypothetical protein